MLTCLGLTARASLIVDGQLPASESFGVRFHLLVCPYCRRFLRQLRGLVGAVAQRGEQKNAAPVSDAFADRLVQAMLAAPSSPPAQSIRDRKPPPG